MYNAIDEFFRTDNICIDGFTGYFISYDFGEGEHLFSVNYKTRELKYLSKIPQIEKLFRAHPYCIKNNNIIYCLPANGKDILCYDFDSDKWNIIVTDDKMMDCPEIIFAWVDKGILYAFISKYGIMSRISLEDGKQSFLYPPQKSIPCGYDVAVNSQKTHICYTAKINENKIFRWNMDLMKCDVYMVPHMNEGIGTIALIDNTLYMTGYTSGDIYIWEIGETNTLHIENKVEIISGKEGSVFIQSRVINRILLFFSSHDNYVYYFDTDNLLIERFPIPIESNRRWFDFINHSIYKSQYELQYTKGQCVGIYSYHNHSVYEFDSLEKKFKKMEFIIDDYNWKCAIKSIGCQKMKEQYDLSTQVYWYLLHHKPNESLSECKKNVGESIWSVISQ
ncbi:hypothetical protein [Selenomonas ruminantium]|uniref:hypothetical protein n=1 Tax=Selenomonas ruminantium TaxID=971 RepID=UPI0004037408|nr:hypothetical protein [Selenomonas ruminantium]